MTERTRPPALFRRVRETARPVLRLTVDGVAIDALAGDTLLVALLTAGARLRVNEFDGAPRAGFCLMGACQDCWVWTADGAQLRACSTVVTAGMDLVTEGPVWPTPRS